MITPAVRIATGADEAAVIDAIVLAFATDPITRWCWPDPHQYVASMPDFTRAMGGDAFVHGSAHCTDDYAGAALWLPPGMHMRDGAAGEVVDRTTAKSIMGDLTLMYERMASFHPAVPHWYLPLIGVDPIRQGRGCGAALLKFALERCDRDGIPAYLESTNPRNVTLYQRHGFEALGTIQVGSSPPMVPMLRPPR